MTGALERWLRIGPAAVLRPCAVCLEPLGHEMAYRIRLEGELVASGQVCGGCYRWLSQLPYADQVEILDRIANR